MNLTSPFLCGYDQGMAAPRTSRVPTLPTHISDEHHPEWLAGWVAGQQSRPVRSALRPRPLYAAAHLRRVIRDISTAYRALLQAGQGRQAIELAKAQGSDDLRIATFYWISRLACPSSDLDWNVREEQRATQTWEGTFGFRHPSIYQRLWMIQAMQGHDSLRPHHSLKETS